LISLNLNIIILLEELGEEASEEDRLLCISQIFNSRRREESVSHPGQSVF
jgi:hypothetical protein